MNQRPVLAALMAATVVLTGCQTPAGENEQAGVIIGGVLGGLLGHQVGKGSGRTAATIIGSVVGSQIGGSPGRWQLENPELTSPMLANDYVDRLVSVPANLTDNTTLRH